MKDDIEKTDFTYLGSRLADWGHNLWLYNNYVQHGRYEDGWESSPLHSRNTYKLGFLKQTANVAFVLACCIPVGIEHFAYKNRLSTLEDAMKEENIGKTMAGRAFKAWRRANHKMIHGKEYRIFEEELSKVLQSGGSEVAASLFPRLSDPDEFFENLRTSGYITAQDDIEAMKNIISTAKQLQQPFKPA